MTLTPEQKRAWQSAKNYFYHPGVDDSENILADALRDTLAALMESEFKAQHFEVQTADSAPGNRKFMCLGCNYFDSRHNNTKADWKQAAEAVLREP